MRFSITLLVLMMGCQSVEVGPSYIDRGYQFEIDAFKAKSDGTPIGLRASVGQVWLPENWANKYGDYTMRYALGPFVRLSLPYGFYFEPRFEGAYYPALGTAFEPEVGARIGWSHNHFQVFFGERIGLGNGNDHERVGDYEHIYYGWKPEFGISWGFDW